MPNLFAKERIIAPVGYNRWLVPPASIAIHLCIGSVYAWSNFNGPLTKVQGVLAGAPADWTLSQVVWIFTVAIVVLGLSAAFAGKWLEQVGPRTVGTVAAICWGGGFLIGSLGIWLHQLWLLYLGYGVVGGCGLGLGYVSPVSTLLKWFPDRRGMATGMAIMGFGGGAIIGAPLIDRLVDGFQRPPEYLGARDAVDPVVRNGSYFVATQHGERPVIVIFNKEAAALPRPAKAGVYFVGTGSSGVGETFVVLGVGYSLVMLLAAFSYRLPGKDWRPAGWTPRSEAHAAKKMISTRTVSVDAALKTRQFYLLWIVLCFNVTAGIGMLGVAKTMLSEIFGPTLPDIVTPSFASTFVLMIGVFNMLGRFFWSSLSDYWGRKSTYGVYFLLGIPLYLSIPFWANRQSASPSLVWLVGFYVATMAIFTLYGGGFLRWWLRDNSGLSGRSVRLKVRRRHSRSLTDGVEHRGSGWPLGDHRTPPEFATASHSRPGLPYRTGPFRREVWRVTRSTGITLSCQDGHAPEADGDRAIRNDQPFGDSLQLHHVRDGRTLGCSALGQRSNSAGERKALLNRISAAEVEAGEAQSHVCPKVSTVSCCGLQQTTV
jgi:MFS family permease